MIDAIVKLSEKLVELLKYRNERRAKRFKEVVDPVFSGLLPVHKNYISIIERVHRDLASNTSVGEIESRLWQERQEFEAERRMILTRVNSIMEIDALKEHAAFFAVVVEYFEDVPIGQVSLTTSAFLLGSIQSILKGNATRESVKIEAAECLKFLRRRWEIVVGSHAREMVKGQ